MNKSITLLSFTLCLLFMASCKDHEGVPFNISDPQEVMRIDTVIPSDLLYAFGEEYIHFGHTPPSFDSLSFKIVGTDYDSCIRYVFGPDYQAVLSHTDPPVYDATTILHHFYEHSYNYSKHRMKTIDSHNNQYVRQNDTVFIIGNTDSFTAYYIEHIIGEDTGNPTNAIIISATIKRNAANNIVGVTKYRIGKKILRYDTHPTIDATHGAYAQGTIEIKTHDALSPIYEWDTTNEE